MDAVDYLCPFYFTMVSLVLRLLWILVGDKRNEDNIKNTGYYLGVISFRYGAMYSI